MTGWWMVPPFARKSDLARAISVGISCALPFPWRRLRCRSVCGNAALCKRRPCDSLRRAIVEPTARSVLVSPRCDFALAYALWIPALRSGLRALGLANARTGNAPGFRGFRCSERPGRNSPRMRALIRPSLIVEGQLAELGERFVEVGDFRAGDAAG